MSLLQRVEKSIEKIGIYFHIFSGYYVYLVADRKFQIIDHPKNIIIDKYFKILINYFTN